MDRRPLKTRGALWAKKLAQVMASSGFSPNQVSILSIFISNRVTNAISSISFSSIACWLVEVSTIKGVVLYAVSGAFLGSALLAIVERVAVYKPAVVKPTRPE